jgi:CBS-domain-containing membrane protein
MTRVLRDRTVSDVMTSSVHVATPLTPVKLLVRLIKENRVSAIPIVDQWGTPIGIVSATDLLLKERAKAAGTVASEVMTSPVVTVGLKSSVSEAEKVMQERSVRRLVVVDERGRIAGIVSRSDLLQVFLRGDEDLHEKLPAGSTP